MTKGDDLWTEVQKEKIYQALTQHLNLVKAAYDVYEEIQVADALTGTIIASTQNTDLGKNIFQEEFFTKTIGLGYSEVIDIKKDPLNDKFNLCISHAIKAVNRPNENEDKVSAVLIMHVNPDDMIKPMLHTGEGLGKTGEALLVNQDARIITPLKHPLPDGTIAKPLEYQIKAKPAMLAARGEEGAIATEDYRGIPVLAAYRCIPITSELMWGMVIKRDQAEVFAPLRQSIVYSSLIGLISILTVLGLTFLIANNISYPIRALSQTAQLVEAGDLNARAPINTLDDVGILATRFNSMVQRIQGWHEEHEEQVKARTAQLNSLNEELMKEITERKQAEEALRKDNASLADAQRITHLGNWDWDLRTNELCWSDEIYRIFGLTPREVDLTYQSVLNSVHPEDRGFVQKSVDESLYEKKPYNIDHRIIRPNGVERIVHAHGEVTFDETGSPIRMVGTLQDLTERKQAEEALERQAQELARSNADLKQFAHVVSHDLQEPLRMISSYTQLLAKRYKGKLDADAGEFIEYTVDGVNRMHELINGLLDYSRVGTQDKYLGSINSEDVFDRALVNLQKAIEESGAVVTHDPLPMVVADDLLLRQLFQNLIGNAIKFHGEEPPRIHFSAEQRGNEWVFSVRDNGIGIDPEYTDRIFVIFQRLHSRKEYPGTGIGLAICKKVVEHHDGRIWVESQSGKGSTFYFTIPIRGDK